MTALEDIPQVEKSLLNEKGEAYLQKTDIFGKIMWFGYAGESMWHPISAKRVKEILELNSKGQKPENLQVDQDLEKIELVQAVTNDLERLDRKYSPKSKNRRKSKNKRRKNPNRNASNPKK